MKMSKFDPLETIQKASNAQSGLPKLNTKKNEGQGENNKKGIGNQENIEGTTITEENKEEFGKDKENFDQSGENEEKSEYELMSGEKATDNEDGKDIGSGSPNNTSGKVKKASAKVLVSKGDQLQQWVTIGFYDYRAEAGLKTAKNDYNRLHQKVVKQGELNEKERSLFKYAKEYIDEAEKRRKAFEKHTGFSNHDRAEMIELLEAYMEETGWQPSPLFMVSMIILITLGSNIYAAWTSHPTYNPPI
jgi:hypothetical protein